MKKLTIILILFALTISVNAQYSLPIKKKIPEPVKIITIFAGSIILDAMGDALCDNDEKVWGHGFQAASIGLLLASPFILDIEKGKWPWYLASYISLRIALFDPIYNSTRGLPMDYIGDCSLWDKGLQEFNPPGNSLLWGRSVFLIVGISIPINELK